MTRSHILLGLIIGYCLVPHAVYADDVTEAVDRAEIHYSAGQLPEAAEALRTAIDAIETQLAGRLIDVFPPAPEGWSAQPAEELSMPGLGATAMRQYAETGGGGSYMVQVLVDSPSSQMTVDLLRDPHAASAMGFEQTDLDGRVALVSYIDSPAGGMFQAQMMIEAGQIIVNGIQISDVDQGLNFLRGFDFALLAAIAGR